MGGPEVPLRDQEFLGFNMILSEIYLGFLQDCCTPHSSDEEGHRFSLGPEQQTDFETLRQRLYEAPMLTLLEGVEDFMVFCDVSITGLGAVLMQRGRVIAYSSQ